MKLEPLQALLEVTEAVGQETQLQFSVLKSRVCSRGRFKIYGRLKVHDEEHFNFALKKLKNLKLEAINGIQCARDPSELRGKHELPDEVYTVEHFEHSLKNCSCFSHNMESCPETILDVSMQMT